MPRDHCELLCLDLPHAEAVRRRMAGDPAAGATRARALADPTRVRLATALDAGSELCVCDLAWICGLAQNLVSHHVRALRTAGLAGSRRDGKLVMYRLTPAGRALLRAVLGPADAFATTPAAASGPEQA